MTNRKTLRLRRTGPITKAAILAAAVLALVALVALYSAIDRVRTRYDDMRAQAMELESENDRLKIRIDELGTPESTLRIAMEELGLTFPDSVVITPGD